MAFETGQPKQFCIESTRLILIWNDGPDRRQQKTEAIPPRWAIVRILWEKDDNLQNGNFIWSIFWSSFIAYGKLLMPVPQLHFVDSSFDSSFDITCQFAPLPTLLPISSPSPHAHMYMYHGSNPSFSQSGLGDNRKLGENRFFRHAWRLWECKCLQNLWSKS